MRIDLDNLPSELALLQHLVRDMAAVVEHRDGEIERLMLIIKKLQRAQFGRRSERLDPDQLALGLEVLDGDLARENESRPRVEKQQAERSSHRKPLPSHLPRDVVRLDIGGAVCACCGGVLHVIGESVSARTIDCRRIGDAGADSSGVGQQILRSHAALSAITDLQPAWRRSCALDTRGLGRGRLLSDGKHA
jgi:hypothetical protein